MKVEKIGQIFRCSICGNEIIITKVGGGEVKCCDKPMELVVDNTIEYNDEEDEEAEE